MPRRRRRSGQSMGNDKKAPVGRRGSEGSPPPPPPRSSPNRPPRTGMRHHDHGHDHEHQAVPSDLNLRVKALESLLVEKGLVDRAALDAVVDAYETKIGPRNGARVVRARLGRSGLQEAPADRRQRGDRRARLRRRSGRGHGGRSRTRRRSTTSSSARCARAIRGRSSVCRRSGTSRRRIAPVR